MAVIQTAAAYSIGRSLCLDRPRFGLIEHCPSGRIPITTPEGMRRVTYRRLQTRANAKLDRYHEHLNAGLWHVLARIAPETLNDLLS
jgi:hypothetical protein